MKRHIALLGGTTTLSDTIVTASKLMLPYNLTDGSYISKYEEIFAKKVGSRLAISFSTGRVGLYGLLKSFGIGYRDEIILQVPTHIVVSNAIKYAGATPVYVDCSLENYNINLNSVRSKITSHTKAIILQHTFGIPVDINEAIALAKKHGLIIIEDCVHALGATYDGKNIGSFGHASFFSTEETKICSTTMGGMVVTDDPIIANKMKEFQKKCSIPNFWSSYRYLLKYTLYYFLLHPNLHKYTRALYELFGNRLPLPRPTTYEELIGKIPDKYEQRLSNGQALIGLRQLNKLDENLKHRRKIASIYDNKLRSKGLKVLEIPEKSEPSYVRYPVWVEDRTKAVSCYKPYGVLGTWFTSVLEEAISPSYGDYVKGSCPNAELAAQHLVNLPTHQKVKISDAEKLFNVLEDLIIDPVKISLKIKDQ